MASRASPVAQKVVLAKESGQLGKAVKKSPGKCTCCCVVWCTNYCLALTLLLSLCMLSMVCAQRDSLVGPSGTMTQS